MTRPNRSATHPDIQNPAPIPFVTQVVPPETDPVPQDVTTRKITDAASPSAGDGFLVLRDLIIPLSLRKETLLGRDSSRCNVVLADSRVSKLHAAIYFSGGRFFLPAPARSLSLLRSVGRVDAVLKPTRRR